MNNARSNESGPQCWNMVIQLCEEKKEIDLMLFFKLADFMAQVEKVNKYTSSFVMMEMSRWKRIIFIVGLVMHRYSEHRFKHGTPCNFASHVCHLPWRSQVLYANNSPKKTTYYDFNHLIITVTK